MNTVHFHPMVVHFSIALVVIGFVFDAYYIFIRKKEWKKTAGFFIMLLAAVAIFASWLTGEFFSRSYDGTGRDLKDLHELYANITYLFFIISFAIRIFVIYFKKEKKSYKYLFLIFQLLAVLTIVYCGYLGGLLVYDYSMDLRIIQQ